jgi:hypothetical protein
MLTSGSVFLHINAHPHTAAKHTSTAEAFQLGVVWPPNLQSSLYTERPPPVYLPEELGGITALQQ